MEGGQLVEARALIREICERGPVRDRAQALQLAYLGRRTGYFEAAFHLLGGVIHGDGRRKGPATEEERAEYGMALAGFGLTHEAISLLSGVDVKKFPWTFYGLTLAYFRQWEWEKTLPTIERFLSRPGITLHDRLWGTYHLGRALLHGTGEVRKARALFEGLARDAVRHSYPMLRIEALIGQADASLESADWKAAVHALEPVRSEDSRPGSLLGLSVRLRLAEAGGLRSRGSKTALRELRAVRKDLGTAGRYDMIRWCDLTEWRHFHDKAALQRLWFGTPFAGARSFLQRLGARKEDLPSSYRWPSAGSRRVLDLVAGSADFEPGRLPLRTLAAIAADFYVPVTIPALFERLYPAQYFHPVAGPTRVWQALHSARRTLKSARLPLEIAEERGTYRLVAAEGFALEIARPDPSETGGASARLRGLLQRFTREVAKGESFGSSGFASRLGLSDRSARRYLGEAARAGLLETTGAARARRYRFPKARD